MRIERSATYIKLNEILNPFCLISCSTFFFQVPLNSFYRFIFRQNPFKNAKKCRQDEKKAPPTIRYTKKIIAVFILN